MMPIISWHAGCVNRLNELLIRRLGDEATVSVRNPIHLSEHSQPQPDIAVPRRDARAYRDRDDSTVQADHERNRSDDGPEANRLTP